MRARELGVFRLGGFQDREGLPREAVGAARVRWRRCQASVANGEPRSVPRADSSFSSSGGSAESGA